MDVYWQSLLKYIVLGCLGLTVLFACDSSDSVEQEQKISGLALKDSTHSLPIIKAEEEITKDSIRQKEVKENRVIIDHQIIQFSKFKTTAQKVLDQIYEVSGGDRSKKPEVQIIQNKSIIAQYKPGTNKIEIEERLFDVCKSMKEDSLAVLAFVIGHELAHTFQMQKLLSKKKMVPFLAYDIQYPSQIREEKIADLHGVFAAYLSGYLKTGDIIPEIINRIYTTFQLHDKPLIQYDDFSKRMLIAEEVKLKVDTLKHVFELGNFCMITSEHEIATACYEYILPYYQGAEIFNNLGLSNILAGMKVGGKRADAFVYPFELDVETKLTQVRAESDVLLEEEKIKRAKYFEKALNYLDKAIEKKSSHGQALLNKFSLLSLSNQQEEAIDFYKSIENLPIVKKKKLPFQLTLALAFLQIEQKEKGIRLLQNLGKENDSSIMHLAKYNLASFENYEWEGLVPTRCLDLTRLEIDDEQRNQFHLYPSIPVFKIHPYVKIGWEKSHSETRWIAKWKNQDHLKLFQMEVSAQNFPVENQTFVVGSCNFFVESSLDKTQSNIIFVEN